MSSQRAAYLLSRVYLTIDGKRIEGGLDDGFVTITPNSPMGSMSRDLSGDSTFTLGTDRSATAKIKLKGNSLGAKALATIFRTFLRNAEDGTAQPVSFRFADDLAGTKVRESEAWPLEWPELTSAKDRGDVEFTLDLPHWRDGVEIAANA